MERAEAIKIIKSATVYTPEEMEALETLIPELRESEDERIRKWIIEELKDSLHEIEAMYSGDYDNRDEHDKERQAYLNKALAYLEKQKEQKPNIELIQRSWYMEGYHDREFGKEPKWILKTGEGGPKHELNPKYGQPLTGQQVTEEQLHNLNEAIKSLRMDGCEKIADSLHSLYDILKTQRTEPAEWSEEDEKIIDTIVSILGQYVDYKAVSGTGSGYATPRYNKEIAWLKSIRPSWKPSEGQMKAFYRCVDYLEESDNEDADIMAELYERLK